MSSQSSSDAKGQHTPSSLADVLERDYFPMPYGKNLYLNEYECKMVIAALRATPPSSDSNAVAPSSDDGFAESLSRNGELWARPMGPRYWSHAKRQWVLEAPSSGTTISQDAADAARYRWLRDRNPNQLNLTRNDHAANYHTVEEELRYFPDRYEDVPEEVRKAMIEADTIWCLQIYPRTPVGFNWIHHATLDDVIDEAIKEGM